LSKIRGAFKFIGRRKTKKGISMVETLEKIKQLGAYSVNVTFGEDVGCDDSDVPLKDRNIVCIWYPVGCLGERRCMWKGIYSDFVKFDFSTAPKPISNPPKSAEYEEPGFYTWGTERSMERAAANTAEAPQTSDNSGSIK
jgi:hypothetical protein